MGTREQILEATERVVRDRGLAGTTTKEIARQAGVSEGTLYNHFADKDDLCATMLCEHGTDLPGVLARLPERAGVGTVAANLRELLRETLTFHRRVLPLTISSFADREVLERHRRLIQTRLATSVTPTIVGVVAQYIRAEQRRNRVRSDVHADAVAMLLLSSSMSYVMATEVVGVIERPLPEDRYIREVVRALMHGLEPRTVAGKEASR
jgi:AcrR family transcriptional regulator